MRFRHSVLVLTFVIGMLQIETLQASDAIYRATPAAAAAGTSFWKTVKDQLPLIQNDGYGAILLPSPFQENPVATAADPYGLRDLGDTSSAFGSPTALGSRQELLDLVAEAQRLGLKVQFSFPLDKGQGTQFWNFRRHDVAMYFLDLVRWFVLETKADGLVFEYAASASPTFLGALATAAGVPCVADAAGTDDDFLNTWLVSGLDVADYALQANLSAAFSGSSSQGLRLLARETVFPDGALAFDSNRFSTALAAPALAQAFLLLNDAVPALENPILGDANLKVLINIRDRYAVGAMHVLDAAKTMLVFERGTSLVVGLNTGAEPTTVRVKTSMPSSTLRGIHGSLDVVTTDREGVASMVIPAQAVVVFRNEDASGPQVRFQSPATGAIILTENCDITMTADGSAERVAVRVDGGRWRSAEETTSGWRYRWREYRPGQHLIEARAMDTRHRWGRISTLSVASAFEASRYRIQVTVNELAACGFFFVSVNGMPVMLTPSYRYGHDQAAVGTADVTRAIGSRRTGSVKLTHVGRGEAFVSDVILLDNGRVADVIAVNTNIGAAGSGRRWTVSSLSLAYNLDRNASGAAILFPVDGITWTSDALSVLVDAPVSAARVAVVVNGGLEQPCAVEGGKFVVRLAGLTNGVYTIRAHVIDDQGVSFVSPETSIRVKIDSSRYVLTWEGYDWDFADEVRLTVNDRDVAWTAPIGEPTRNRWASFSVDVTDAIGEVVNGRIVFKDTYGNYRNLIRNVRLAGPGVEERALDPKHGEGVLRCLDRVLRDVPAEGLSYQYRIDPEKAKIVDFLVAPNPFSPNGDGRRENAAVSFRIIKSMVPWRVEIADGTGKLVREYSGFERGPRDVSCAWDGKDKTGKRVVEGPYAVKLISGASALVDRRIMVKETYCASVVMDTIPPDAVSGIEVNQDGTAILLSWKTNNQADTAKYRVTRTPAFLSNTYRETAVAAYADKEAVPGETYMYIIQAWDRAENAGFTANSSLVTFGYVQVTLVPDADREIRYKDMVLFIPKGAVATNTMIRIKEDTNIRARSFKAMGRAYIFEPDGLVFKLACDLMLSYDAARVPKGFSEDHVHGFTWSMTKPPVNLFRVSLDKGRKKVNSKLWHFSSTGAGVLDLPSNPQAGGGVKTELSKLAKADPLAGLNIIGAPVVNPSGDLSVSYPIPLIKGANGSVPNVALVYNSAGGYGNVGYGWNISVGSSISRVAKRKRGLLTYRADDLFMYNGQELVLIDAGSKAYRPRIDDGSGYLVEQIVTDGMVSWKARDRAGNTYWFGKDANGKNDAYTYDPDQPKDRINSWQLVQQEDSNGNTIRYSYLRDNNSLYPETVLYANEKRQVKMVWGNRQDKRISYINGYKQISGLRLSNVHVQYLDSATTETDTYKLQYAYLNVPYQSYLTNISHERGVEVLSKASFAYEKTYCGFSGTAVPWAVPHGFTAPADLYYTYSAQDGKEQHREIGMADMDGDGLPDYVFKHRNNPYFLFYKNTNSGFDQSIKQWDIKWPTNAWTWDISTISSTTITIADMMDLNGDGYQDFVFKTQGTQQGIWCQNTGTGFLPAADWFSPRMPVNDAIRYFYRNSGYGDYTEFNMLDMNGDGMLDRVWKHRNNAFMYISTNEGASFGPVANVPCNNFGVPSDLTYVWTPNSEGADTQVDTIDINGDGLPDRVARYGADQAFHVMLNNGHGFEPDTLWPCPGFLGVNYLAHTYTKDDRSHVEFQLMDINGDGLPDYVMKHRSEGFYRIHFNNGMGFDSTETHWNSVPLTPNGIQCENDITYTYTDSTGRAHTELSMVDMDGDGLVDRVAKHRDAAHFAIELNKTKTSLLLAAVTNGIGGHYEIGYQKKKNSASMPFTKTVVQTLKAVDDISGFAKTNTYIFNNGVYDRTEKQFLGFNEMIVQASDKSSVRTLFHTNGIALAGKSYLTIAYDPSGFLLGKTTQKWQVLSLESGPVVTVVPKSSTNYKYDGKSADSLPIAEAVKIAEYDNYGYQGVCLRKETSISGSKTAVKDYTYCTKTINGILLRLIETTKDTLKDAKSEVLVASKELVYCNDEKNAGKVFIEKNHVLTREAWLETTYTYFDNGMLKSKKDPLGAMVQYEYDVPTGVFVVKETTTTPASEEYIQTTKYEDLSYGLPASVIDPYDLEVIYTYGSVNKRLASVSMGTVKLLDVVYADSGLGTKPLQRYAKTTTYFDDTGSVDKITYLDGFGKTLQEKEQYSGGRYISTGRFKLDRVGRVVKQGETFVTPGKGFDLYSTSSPLSNTSSSTFDNKGRVLTSVVRDVNNTELSSSKNVYSESDQTTVIETTDAMGRVKRISKDIYGNVKEVVDDSSSSKPVLTSYEYDILNRLTSLTESGGSMVTTIKYDNAGRKTLMKTPDTGITTYGYDDYGRMTGETNAKGVATKYVYDTSGRLIKTVFFDGKEIVYQYGSYGNLKGRLHIERGLGYTNTFDYDALGQVIKESRYIDGETYVTAYGWNLAGQVKRIDYPGGRQVHYSYDSTGDLQKVGSSLGGTQFVQEIKRNKDGQRTYIKYGNGTYSTYKYRSATKAIQEISTYDANAAVLQRLTYDIDNLGNVKSINDGVSQGMTSYVYDSLNRLRKASASGYSQPAMNFTESYDFDENGSLTKKTGVGNYSLVTGTHRIAAAGLTSFDYDNTGNMITKTSNTNTIRYSYDVRDHLTAVTNEHTGDGGGSWSRFAYTGDGQRLKKWSSSGNSTLYVNGYHSVKNGKYTNDHVFVGSERVCTLVNGEPSFIHRDLINSGGVITTNNGGVGDRLGFAPYGEVKYQQNTNSQIEEKFTGQILDVETGLYYYNSRYYDPRLGIFLSPDSVVPDPFDSQSMNRYMYVRGNPVKYLDPDGHFFIELGIGKDGFSLGVNLGGFHFGVTVGSGGIGGYVGVGFKFGIFDVGANLSYSGGTGKWTAAISGGVQLWIFHASIGASWDMNTGRFLGYSIGITASVEIEGIKISAGVSLSFDKEFHYLGWSPSINASGELPNVERDSNAGNPEYRGPVYRQENERVDSMPEPIIPQLIALGVRYLAKKLIQGTVRESTFEKGHRPIMAFFTGQLVEHESEVKRLLKPQGNPYAPGTHWLPTVVDSYFTDRIPFGPRTKSYSSFNFSQGGGW